MTERLGAFRWVLALAVGGAALPVLLVTHLPLQDLPQHLLVATVLTHYDDVGSDFCDHFLRAIELRPYLGYYGVALLMGHGLDVETTARLCLLWYLIATPVAVFVYTREVGGTNGVAALLAVPALFTAPYYLGFLNFIMAIPALFLALCCLHRLARSGGIAAAAGYVGFSALTWLCHASAFGLLVLVSVPLPLVARDGRRRGRALALALAVMTAGVALAMPSVALPDRPPVLRYVTLDEPLPPQGPDRGLVFSSPLASALAVIAHLTNDPSMMDGALWGMPLGALVLARVAARRRGSPAAPRAGYGSWLLPLASVVLLFVAPAGTSFTDCLNTRFLAFLFPALAAVVPDRLLDPRTRATLATFVLLSLGIHVALHVRFDREASEFDPVLAAIPERATVMPVVTEPESAALLRTMPYLHYGHLVQAARGGLGREPFGGAQIPIRMRPEGLTGMWLLTLRPWLSTARVVTVDVEWVLTRGAVARLLVPPSFEPVVVSGAFALYRAPRGDVAPR